jgi:3-hexulose-6-phosphate synthase/6-phospho-3-hexuloisomerase
MSGDKGEFPVLQVALDFVDTERALKVAKEASAGGGDWLEVGTPLIKSEGLNAVRRLREEFPDKTIIADMKTMDAGRAEVETAAKAGASISVVLGAASDSTIRQCIEAGKNYGCRIYVDLIGLEHPAARAKEAEKLGADYVGVHIPIDDQMQGRNAFQVLRDVAEAVDIPVAVAGGVNSESVAEMIENGASILIVGGAIHKSENATEATATIKKAMTEKKSIASNLFRRGTEADIKDILLKTSTSNLSDAMHRGGALEGINRIIPVAASGVKVAGPVLTVRTAPGDWAKPVEAIDRANKGDILVIDAGGIGPAIWGGCATHSCLKRGLAAVVINGYVRDMDDLIEMNFPVFAKGVMPNAGEPKGFGDIGCPISIGGQFISAGDWVMGDASGVVTVAKADAVEYANRAQDVLETENRINAEIEEGSTLGQVINLLKWEKR